MKEQLFKAPNDNVMPPLIAMLIVINQYCAVLMNIAKLVVTLLLHLEMGSRETKFDHGYCCIV